MIKLSTGRVDYGKAVENDAMAIITFHSLPNFSLRAIFLSELAENSSAGGQYSLCNILQF